MGVNTPFFGKRETPSLNARASLAASASTVLAQGAAAAAESARSAPEPQRTPVALPQDAGSTLTVGPNIKLKGVEITDCDTLVVQGTVEATMDSRVIQIAPQGAFHGAAEIDRADIHGEFVGTLTVRGQLRIHPTGKVRGTVRYGTIVVEEGGQLAGDIAMATPAAVGPTAGRAPALVAGSAAEAARTA